MHHIPIRALIYGNGRLVRFGHDDKVGFLLSLRSTLFCPVWIRQTISTKVKHIPLFNSHETSSLFSSNIYTPLGTSAWTSTAHALAYIASSYLFTCSTKSILVSEWLTSMLTWPRLSLSFPHEWRSNRVEIISFPFLASFHRETTEAKSWIVNSLRSLNNRIAFQ